MCRAEEQIVSTVHQFVLNHNQLHAVRRRVLDRRPVCFHVASLLSRSACCLLDAAAIHRGVLKAHRVVPGGAHVLRRGANFKHLVDGFPETMEVVLDQTCKEDGK